MVTALLYTRVSKDEQAREGLSLDAQLAECRRYAAQQGWVIGGEFQDVMTGIRDDRPQYQQLLSAARLLRRRGDAVVVTVAALDRFGRRLIERVRSREELKTLGIPVHSVREGGEVSDLTANILGAVAEEEVRLTSARIKTIRAHIVASGWWPVTRAPFGYQLRPAIEAERHSGAPASVLALDELTAPYVREAFERVAAGESVRQVFLWILGLPPEIRGGRRMPYQQVRAMLARPVYAARPDHGAVPVLARPVGHWPQLIPDRLYERVGRHIVHHEVIHHQAKGTYLLTGMLACPRCGGRVNGDLYRGGYRYYRCSGHADILFNPQSDPRCTWAGPCSPIDAAALLHVGPLLPHAADPTQLRLAWADLTRPTDLGRERAQRVSALERAALQARARFKAAALKLVDGELDKAGYELVREAATQALEAAEAELDRLQAVAGPPGLPSLEVALAALPSWEGALAEASVPAQRAVLGALIARVVPIRLGRGAYDVELTWSPLGSLLAELPKAGSCATG
jgi:DNA invertase Pin-like site-specific DNA recombinase